jgi:hypothetical protein
LIALVWYNANTDQFKAAGRQIEKVIGKWNEK